MKLYSHPLSPFAGRVRISIYRKGLDQIEIAVPPDGPGSAAFRAINPLGQIPALQLDSGFVLPELAAILEYLEDAFPTPSLLPADPEQRARARLFLRLPDIHFQNAPRTLLGMRDPAQRKPEVVDTAFENLHRGLGYIEHFLAPGPWAVGDAASIADCAMVPVLNVVGYVTEVYQRPDLLAPYPNIRGYWRQASAEPIHARVIAEQNEARQRLVAPRPA